MMKSILLAVDGSAYTETQLKYAIQLAKALDSVVRVLSVVDVRIFEWAVVMGNDGFVPIMPSTVYKEESRKILDEKADAVLEKCDAILTKEKVNHTIEKLTGAPADLICEKAPLVDILIIGARGEFEKWKKKLVGATADAVVRQWPKPVIVTPKKFNKIKRLLFSYDGSEKANRALQILGVLAAHLCAPVTVLTVHDHEQVRRKLLKEAGVYLEPYGITVEPVGVSGNPEKEIPQVAHDKKCDLILMGAFGHSRIREAILGSTTEQVIRNTSTPVLLAK